MNEPFPLTDLQEAYLVGMNPGIELGGFRPGYYLELDLVGLNVARAQRAVSRLVSRHEQLRTLVLPDGRQQVLSMPHLPPLRLPVQDLTGLPAAEQEEALAQTRRRMCEQGLDPGQWPLFEIVVSQIRPRRARMHMCMSLLLLDGHGIRAVLAEWLRLYHEPDAELPAVPRTYREARLRLLDNEHSESYQAHWQYWLDRLDALPEAPTLPLAVRLDTLEQVRFTRRTCHLDRAAWQRLRRRLHSRRLLPTGALLHVFAEVLGVWADSPHFCLNVLHQGWVMRHLECSGVVGQFGATLPLEVDLREGSDLWQRARQVQRQLWQDLEHSDVTAVRITRELAARRGWTTRATLPYVFTSMLGSGGADAAIGRALGRVVTSALRTPQVLIDNQVTDAADGGIDCTWDVVDDAFPAGLPEEMFAVYRNLLATLAGAAAEPPDEPQLVPAAHRARIAAVNDTAGPSPAGRLEDGFLRQTAIRPDAAAVIAPERTLTYRDLDALSQTVADWLRGHGIGRGDIVPVVMVKGWEQVVAVLGVLRAGAAYCPVDAGQPDARRRALLDACAARVVLAQSGHPADPGDPADPDAPRRGPRGRYTLRVDQIVPASAQREAGDPAGDPADLAYVIHTSGSTGAPKGVLIDHRGAGNTIADVNQRVGLRPGDRVFGISALTFDLSVWDVFGTLAAGATLILPTATPVPDPEGWAQTAAAEEVTVWNSVPALAGLLAEVMEHRPTLSRPPVRAFLLSGDWIPLSLPNRLRRLWPGAGITSMGGATEASIWSNVFEVGVVDPAWRSIPYGTPLRNQTMRVLDHRMRVRPAWATGRIYIGGTGVARGYLGDPERTAERFVTDPWTGEPLYWTGDLGRYRPDGVIELLGREDRQVKIQGFRVEPGEVEAAVRSHPEVDDCAVCVQDVPGGQRRLVCFAVPRRPGGARGGQIADYLRSRLPRYLVPGRVLTVDRLPLGANGKVDPARAAVLLAQPREVRDDGSAPAGGDFGTDIVRRLAKIWAGLLQVPSVEPGSDFFALGGTSLLALRMLNQVRAELGVDLGFGEVLATSSLESLAARVGRSDTAGHSAVRLSDAPGQALFLFHPVGGSVTSYRSLARAWPGPVHAFQSPALTAGLPPAPAPDLVAMAAGYRTELLRLAPQGPHLLGGWSMGGVLAHEVARQLAENGHRPSVFMIDSTLDGHRAAATELGRHLEFLTDLSGGRPAPELIAAVRGAVPGAAARAARDAAVAEGLLPAEVDIEGYLRLAEVHAHNLAALAGYRPACSGVPTLLFAAAAAGHPDQAPAWRTVCPAVEVRVTPHDHYSIVTADHLATIAEQVSAWHTLVRTSRS